MKIFLKINKKEMEFDIQGSETVYDILKSINITSVKKSCDTGVCGLCTVLLNGRPIPSCSYLAAKADGGHITTIEAVEEEAEKFGRFMNQEGAIQCAYCTPGFVLTVISMKDNLKNFDDESINKYLVGNLCRCSGYQGHLRAIKKYLGVAE